MTIKKLIALAKVSGLRVEIRNHCTYISENKKQNALGVIIFSDNTIFRSDIPLIMTRKMRVIDAAKLFNL